MFTEGQQKALYVVKSGGNLLLTGPGGSGKSHFINEIKDEHTVLIGPSGISAVNIGGMTAASLFALPLGCVLPSDHYKSAPKAEKLFANSSVKRLVIDEAGMLRSDQFSLIDSRLRKITRNDSPWGGLQVILVSDLWQLAPIVAKSEQDIFWKHNQSAWFFDTLAFESGNFETVVLNEILRQTDERQQRILQSIRVQDQWWTQAVDRVNEITSPKPIDAVWLCSYNKQVISINQTRYRELGGTEKIYRGKNKGFRPHELPVDAEIRLKEGTRVLIKANAQDGSYQNGSAGIVESMEDKCVWVKKDDGDIVCVEPFEWTKYSYVMGLGGMERKKEASFTALPIKQGYAISIHASQGMSIDKGNIDLGRGAFSEGQLYVSLSRFRDLTQVYIQGGVNYNDVIVSKDVKRYYKSLEEKS